MGDPGSAPEPELKSVVQRIFDTAKQFYNDDIHTHIQSIYNRLSDNEQLVFLRGIIAFLPEMMQPHVCPIDCYDEENAEFSVETYNQVELIKLRTWIIKCIVIVVAAFMAIAFIYMLVTSVVKPEGEEHFSEFIEFIKTLME